MAPEPDFDSEIQSIVAGYLDGAEPFDAAARQLAVLLVKVALFDQRIPDPTKERPIRLRIPTIAEWMSPHEQQRPVRRSLAPGRSPAAESKARALMDEAIRLAATLGGDAA